MIFVWLLVIVFGLTLMFNAPLGVFLLFVLSPLILIGVVIAVAVHIGRRQ